MLRFHQGLSNKACEDKSVQNQDSQTNQHAKLTYPNRSFEHYFRLDLAILSSWERLDASFDFSFLISSMLSLYFRISVLPALSSPKAKNSNPRIANTNRRQPEVKCLAVFRASGFRLAEDSKIPFFAKEKNCKGASNVLVSFDMVQQVVVRIVTKESILNIVNFKPN